MSEAATTETYGRIVTNSQEIDEILDKVRMHGTDTDGQSISLVEDCVLRFEDGQIHVKAFDPMKSVWLSGSFAFDGIKREGELVIGDITEFRNYLSRFGERTIVDQTVPEGEDTVHLVFSDEDRKTGAYPAQDEEHINSTDDVDELPYEFDSDEQEYPEAPSHGVVLDTWFECNVSEIKDILADGDTTQVRKYPLSVDDGSVRVRVGDDAGYIETSFEADNGEGDSAALYGYGLDNVFSNLSGEVTIYLVDDGAMWVHQDTEDHTLNYMVAEDSG